MSATCGVCLLLHGVRNPVVIARLEANSRQKGRKSLSYVSQLIPPGFACGKGVGQKFSSGIRNLARLSPKVNPIFEQVAESKGNSPSLNTPTAGTEEGKGERGILCAFFKRSQFIYMPCEGLR